MSLNTTEEIIEDLRLGKMVIIMDDEDRENEGDLVMAAAAVRPEDINFMALYGRGLICLTLTRERCKRLNLPLMPKFGQGLHSTNFTVSIEAAHGVTTGISAADRAATIRAATKPDSKPEDLVQPGHVFPLMAEDGGVLVRAGHTEAGCDLARLAGFEASAVIVEILKEDGNMARRPDLEVFAAKHNLKIGTIEDLIRYRILNEHTVERIDATLFSSEYGDFELVVFNDRIHHATHIALVKGPIDSNKTTLVRVHVENPLYDMFAARDSRGWPLHDAMKRIASAEQGVLVFLTRAHAGLGLLDQVQRLKASHNQQEVESDQKPTDLRTYGIGAQILADLGVKKMHILSAPKVLHGLGAFGLEVLDYISE
ncbi:MAG: 3,4-dihydroxy-2-butanone-4-phosphate synthase [Gammaproteobacteria bacterium]|nr:3,4-dihydroxy-2-butanone-4-phosphate synthase [Gammaproteobacteria bacterium]